MRYQKITKLDVANGPGLRTVLWVSGCSHHCKGCHNPQTWNSNSGEKFTSETLQEVLDSLNNEHVSGITFSGGDPLYVKNRSEVLSIIRNIRRLYPDKTIWLYTGYTFEELNYYFGVDPEILFILRNIDVLVDGRFELDKKDMTLPYCGSTNQRVIDVKETLRSGEVVLYESKIR